MFINPKRIPETGSPVLDAAHVRLAQVVNRAYDQWKAGESLEAVNETLDQFLEMVGAHFGEEEALIRDAGYPDWQKHQETHRAFLATLKDICDRMRDPDRASGEMVETFTFIDRLLYEHEFLDDQEFWETFRHEKHVLAMHEPLIAWSDEAKIGHAEIDRQHETLVKLLNRLHVEIEQGCDREEVMAQLVEIMEHTKWHFAYEERYMLENSLKGYEGHKILHDNLLQEVVQVAQDFEVGRFDRMEDLLENFLKYWLLDHIRHVDVKLVVSGTADG